MLHRIPFPDPVQFSKIAKTSEIPAGIHKNFPDDFHAPPPSGLTTLHGENAVSSAENPRTNNATGRKRG